jgi:hypothetical protein
MPTGAQAVPLADPHWDQNDEGDEWHRCHFVHLIVEGLKRAKVKPLNYSQVTVVQQGLKKTPLPFYSVLRMLSKTIPQWTESQVGEVLLKDKFLTQSATDICKKLKVCG